MTTSKASGAFIAALGLSFSLWATTAPAACPGDTTAAATASFGSPPRRVRPCIRYWTPEGPGRNTLSVRVATTLFNAVSGGGKDYGVLGDDGRAYVEIGDAAPAEPRP